MTALHKMRETLENKPELLASAFSVTSHNLPANSIEGHYGIYHNNRL